MDLLLFGLQGSGKGTQAKLLAGEMGYVIFETGAELRKIAKSGSELGTIVASYIDRGNLAPYEIVMDVVRAFVQNCGGGCKILFDGIPRDEDQMRAFDAMMQDIKRDFVGIRLTIDEEAAVRRIQKRALEQGRADDASEEFIRRRMALFHEKTEPVIDAYAAQGKIIDIDGEGAVEDVYGRIKEALSTVN